MSPSSLVLVAALAGAAALLGAEPARAETVVLVLDRGQGAQASSTQDAALTLRLAHLCQARGDALKVIAVGARANGKPRVVDLSVPLTAPALAALDGKEGTSFDGPSDARAALAAALRGSTPRAPLTLVLLGPFGKVEPTPEGAGFALDTWNRTAPPGSRLLPLSLSPEGAALLSGAKGWQASGTLVLAVGPASFEPEPWSAFDEGAVLSALVRVLVTRIAWGAAAASAPDVTALGAADDVLTRLEPEGDTQRFRLEHPRVRGLSTRLAFEPPRPEGSFAPAAPPAPLEVTWAQVKPEVRWLPPEGAAPGLVALDLERGAAREARLRYRRTASAEPASWITLVERADPGDPTPVELSATVVSERRLSPFLVEGEVALVARPEEPRAARIAGTLSLEPQGEGAGAALRVTYDLAYAPPRARLTLRTPDRPQRLPPATTDAPWTLTVQAENGNAPASVGLAWRTTLAPEQQALLSLRVRRGDQEEQVWRADEVRDLPLGVTFQVRVVQQGGRWLKPEAVGVVRFLAPTAPGLELTVEGEGRVEARKPRHVAEPLDPVYRVDAQDPHDERRLRLTLEPDGCDGEWLAALLDSPPRFVVPPAAEPQAFEVAPLAPGRYEVRRVGPWKGERADIFADRTESLGTWALGDVGGGRLPSVQARVLVPARWGRLGYVLAGLAGLAVLLGLATLRAHRIPPISGTLLYTIEGRAGAVGRLPLAPVGRRPASVTVDGSGRLSLRGSGPVLCRVRPTRVGGMLEVPGEGGRAERRLLVSGLALTVGRHAVRYVQGADEQAPGPTAPEAVPDLLGPEYDLPHSSDAERPPGG